MSGIYIPGMEMPTSCFYCPMRLKVDPDTIKCLATGERFEETFAGTIEMRNRGNCPLIPVPDHGDLIDKSGVAVLSWTDGEHGTDFADGVLFVLDKLDELPVVIPAEGEDYVDPAEEGEG